MKGKVKGESEESGLRGVNTYQLICQLFLVLFVSLLVCLLAFLFLCDFLENQYSVSNLQVLDNPKH